MESSMYFRDIPAKSLFEQVSEFKYMFTKMKCSDPQTQKLFFLYANIDPQKVFHHFCSFFFFTCVYLFSTLIRPETDSRGR